MRASSGWILCALSLVAGCGGDSKPPVAAPPPTYSVGGNVSGLTGAVTLANNGGDVRAIGANGAFTFTTALANGAAYAVTIMTQPANQTCTVTGGMGTVAAANVSAVTVTCVTNTVTIGGNVSGLGSAGLVLQNNGGDNLAIPADGAFTFATSINSGTNFSVTVGTQPLDQNCAVASATGTASANVTTVTVTCTTYRVHATIGAGGGTVTHPDGAQVVIPAGALQQDTVIGIATPASGWPTPFLQGLPQIGSVYEFTPHDVTFAKPVRIRLPKPAGATNTPGAMVAAMGEGWEFAHALLIGNFVEYERLTFSWHTQAWYVCAGSPPLSCGSSADVRYGFTWPSATPGNALVMTAGGNMMAGGTTSVASSAGTWDLDLDSLQSLEIKLEYFSSADCGGTHATLKRYQAGTLPHMVVVQDFTGLPGGHGVVTATVPVQTLDEGTNTFYFQMKCARPGENEYGGGDWITFNARRGAVSGFTLGGTVTGLSVAGLELQNAYREAIMVPAASSTFSFRAPIAAGLAFNVNVRTQPPGARCVVVNGQGTMTADVSNIEVACTPTQSSSVGFAVVANRNGGDLTLFARNSSLGQLSPLETTPSDTGPSAAAIHPNGVYAYIANQDAGSISLFRVANQGGGTYRADFRNSFTTPGPSAIAIDPVQGDYVWVANDVAGSTVTSYRVDLETGNLYGSSTVACGSFPSAIAAHPTGSFVYTVNQADNSISMFRVGSRGVLTSIGTLSNSVLAGTAIEVTADGKFAYALGGSSIGRFSVDTTSGQLSVIGYTSVNGASNADDLVIRKDGKFLFVKSSNSLGASLSTFSIDSSTGALTFSSSVPLPAQGLAQLAIDAAGTALYATNMTTGNVHTFSVDETTGALTLIDTDAAGSGPQGVAVTP